MPAGRRTHRIAIEERSSTQDTDSGEPVETWLRVARPYAEKSYRNAREGMVAGGVQAMRVLRFAVLWTSVTRLITPLTHRVVEGDVVYDITEVNEIGFHAGVEIFAEARAEAAVR